MVELLTVCHCFAPLRSVLLRSVLLRSVLLRSVLLRSSGTRRHTLARNVDWQQRANVAPLQLKTLTSIGEIRALAAAWDRLWQRSDVSLPTARAELAAQWLEHFAPDAAIRVLAVERNGELAAVLPLVAWRYRGVLNVGGLTGNVWSFNGEFLVDSGADEAAISDLLARAMAELVPWPLVWFAMIPIEAPRWQRLLAAIQRQGCLTDVHPRYRIGLAQLDGDFTRFEAQRSKNLRRELGKGMRRLEREGPVEVKIHAPQEPAEVETLLRRAFDVERQSWREESGETVLDVPGRFEFFLRQARQLAAWGYLRLAFLEPRGAPIGFELGWTAKGVYHSMKVGYLSTYRRFGPGHLLRREVLRAVAEESSGILVDFQGPTTDAIRQWSTSSYPIARLIIAPHALGGRVLLAAYKGVAPLVRRLRRRLEA